MLGILSRGKAVTTITLQKYVQTIEKLIDENHFSEAAVHCRHILGTFPRHADTYRLYGKVLLEQHDYDGAADLFQRILSMDPGDFVAHVGMAEVHSNKGHLDQAVWHLERAYEVEPYNSGIQDILRQYYGEMGRKNVTRMGLTSGALARLYVKGELYQQAVQELRTAMQETHEVRADLQVVLAEAYWRNDQRIDAEETCLQVLEQLPDCVAANAILSEIWLQTGRIGESQKYLHRLLDMVCLDQSQLNLETAVGRAFSTDGAPVLPAELEMSFLAVTPDVEVSATAISGPDADWVSQLNFDEAALMQAQAALVNEDGDSGMHSYDWLAEANMGVDDDQEPMDSDWFMDDSMESADLPDEDETLNWLNGLGGEDESVLDMDDDLGFLLTSEPDDVVGSSENLPAWTLDEAADFDLADEGVLEDWLDEGEGATAVTPSTDADWFNEPALTDEPADSATGDLPDWLSDFTDDDAPLLLTEVKAETDWFKDEPKSAASSVEADVPDWLMGADEPAEVTGEALAAARLGAVAKPDVDDETMPDWLVMETNELRDPGRPSGQDADDSLDDWFGGETAVGDDVSAEVEELGGLTGWLSAGNADYGALEAAQLHDEPLFDDWLDEETAVGDDVPAEAEELGGLTGWLSAGNADYGAMEAAQPQDEPLFDDWQDEEETAVGDNVPAEAEELGGLTGWLSAGNADVGALEAAQSHDEPLFDDWFDEEETAVAPTPSTAEKPRVSGLMSWLDDNQADEPQEPEVTEGLTNWLTGSVETVAAPATVDMSLNSWLDDDLADDDDDLLFAEPDMPDHAPVTMDADVQLPRELPADADDDWLSVLAQGDWQSDQAVPDEGDQSLDLADLAGVDDRSLTSLLSEDWAMADKGDSWTTADLAGDVSSEVPVYNKEELGLEPGQDIPDWLMGTDLGQTGKAEAVSMSSMEQNEQEESVPSEFDSDWGGLDDDWLSNFTDEPKTDDALMAAGATAVSAGDDDLFGDVSDWLGDSAEGAKAGTDGDEGLPDWLLAAAEQEADDELDTAVASAAPHSTDNWLDEPIPEAEEGLPDWLMSANPPAASMSDFSDELDDWLTDSPIDEESDEALEVPDWLTGSAGSALETSDDEPEEAIGGLTGMLNHLLDVEEGESEAMLFADEPADWMLDDVTEEPEAMPVAAELDADADDWAFDDLLEEGDTDDMSIAGLTALLSAAEHESHVDDQLTDMVDEQWLEEMSAEDGFRPGETSSLSLADEMGLDWLTGADEPVSTDELILESDLLTPVEASVEPTPYESDGAVTDIDDTMSWLEELASQQETPVDDLPTVAQDLLQDELAELMSVAATDEDNLDFLGDLAMDEEMGLFSDDWGDEDGLSLGDLEFEVADLQAIAGEKPPENEEEAMAWLEGLAARQGAPIEELPSLQMDDEADWDEAADWLMADEDETEEETAVAPTTITSADDLFVSEAEADLEDAMSWLNDITMVGDADGFDLEEVLPAEAEAWVLPEEAVSDAELAFEEENGLEWETAVAVTAVAMADDDDDDELTDTLDWLEAQIKAEGVPMIAVDEIAEVSSDDLVDALDWLEQETAVVEETALPDDAWVEEEALLFEDEWPEEDDLFDMGAEPEAELDLMAETIDELDTLGIPDDPDAAIAWLHQMADDQEHGGVYEEDLPISEDLLMAALQDAESELALDFDDLIGDDDADALAFLEAMMGDDMEIEFDMQPPPITPSADAAFPTNYGATVAKETAVAPTPPAPEPELVEPEMVADEAFDLGFADFDEDGDDADALAFLEAMMGDDMEIEFDMQPPPITPSEDAAFPTSYGTAVAPTPPAPEPEPEPAEPEMMADEAFDLGFADFDEDGDDADALAFLEAMMGDDMEIEFDMQPPPITPSEDAAFSVSYGEAAPKPAAPKPTSPVDELYGTDADLLANVPDEPEEAVAWLEMIAEQQVDELDTEMGASPPDYLPDWMTSGVEDSDDLFVDAILEDMGELDMSDGFEAPLPAAEVIDNLGLSEDIHDSLPDWLPIASDDDAALSQTAWLQSLPELDVSSWLTAEQEATIIDFDEQMPHVDTGRFDQPEAPSRVSSFLKPPITDKLFDDAFIDDELLDAEVDQTAAALPVDERELRVVRGALRDEEFEAAAGKFQEMIASGTSTLALIAELETLADEHPDKPAFRRLLGDAYMRNGQLHKALTIYRDALDQM
jgi:predicted Zn-dependent protease